MSRLPSPWEVASGAVASGVAAGSAVGAAAGTAAGATALAASGATAAGLTATGVGAVAGVAVGIGTALAALILSLEDEGQRYREERDSCGTWLAPFWYTGEGTLPPALAIAVRMRDGQQALEMYQGAADRLLGGMGKAETMRWAARWWGNRGKPREAAAIAAQIPAQEDREREALRDMSREMIWTAVPKLRAAGVPKDLAIRAAIAREILPRSSPMVQMWIGEGRPLEPGSWECRRAKWLARGEDRGPVVLGEGRGVVTSTEKARADRDRRLVSPGAGLHVARVPRGGQLASEQAGGMSGTTLALGAAVVGAAAYFLFFRK